MSVASGGHGAPEAALVVGSVEFCCLVGLTPDAQEHSGSCEGILVVASRYWCAGPASRRICWLVFWIFLSPVVYKGCRSCAPGSQLRESVMFFTQLL